MLLEQVRLEQVAKADHSCLDYLQAQMFHKLSEQCYCVIVVIVVSQGRFLLFIIMLILVCSQSVPVDIRTLTT